MPWNGLGQYLLNPAFSPEVNGTAIDAVRYNGLTSDIAAGISASLAKNGENVPTANLPMGGYKHTGAAPATQPGQYVEYSQALGLGLAVGLIPPLYKSAAYTIVPNDAGYNIIHPPGDANARTFTLQADSVSPWPDGATITFTNWTTQVVSIAAGDPIYLAGDGATGTRSLAQYGICTAIWSATYARWIVSGLGLT